MNHRKQTRCLSLPISNCYEMVGYCANKQKHGIGTKNLNDMNPIIIEIKARLKENAQKIEKNKKQSQELKKLLAEYKTNVENFKIQ